MCDWTRKCSMHRELRGGDDGPPLPVTADAPPLRARTGSRHVLFILLDSKGRTSASARKEGGADRSGHCSLPPPFTLLITGCRQPPTPQRHRMRSPLLLVATLLLVRCCIPVAGTDAKRPQPSDEEVSQQA